jgi:phage terminase large subunit-like protein
VIFEAEPKEDWTLEATWRRVNPGYGVTVKADAIASECAAAQAEPRKLNDFLRYHLNRWVNQVTAWIPVDWWDACKGQLPADARLNELELFAGLDLSQKYDLTAFVLMFREPAVGPATEAEVVGEGSLGEAVKRTVSLNYQAHFVPFFWIPKDTMADHIKRDGVRYDQWEQLGLVRATEGDVIDYDRVLKDITGEIATRFPALQGAPIGYDPAFATDIAMGLGRAGFRPIQILQNYKHLSEPSHIYEAMVRGGRVTHGGHRVLRWNLENVGIRRDDAGRIRPVKPKHAAKRIDGVVASIMGIAVSLLEGEGLGGASIYETRGPLLL